MSDGLLPTSFVRLMYHNQELAEFGCLSHDEHYLSFRVGKPTLKCMNSNDEGRRLYVRLCWTARDQYLFPASAASSVCERIPIGLVFQTPRFGNKTSLRTAKQKSREDVVDTHGIAHWSVEHLHTGRARRMNSGSETEAETRTNQTQEWRDPLAINSLREERHEDKWASKSKGQSSLKYSMDPRHRITCHAPAIVRVQLCATTGYRDRCATTGNSDR
ncbi:transcription factor [Pseudozyma hubeiensis SY62]|uniref:Transcription factor n=1 Tax=Pseudozyma hubeiensis (strain SY62) TaxID=1305764 RepID=R9P9A7_PSEHS|nr:transcription factor [Pseudozyma hubeiensis SY62]GAC94680.1 transcription factor [Pseudozyma hubeiensis SY62]